MAELIELSEIQENVILIGVSINDEDETRQSLEELADLVKTAGANAIATLIQNRESIHPGTYIGKGKMEEAK